MQPVCACPTAAVGATASLPGKPGDIFVTNKVYLGNHDIQLIKVLVKARLRLKGRQHCGGNHLRQQGRRLRSSYSRNTGKDSSN